MPKNWCFRIVVLKTTFESPLDCKGVKSVNPKGNQPWTFSGRTDAEFWPDVLDSLKKTLMLGKIEGKRRGGAAEDVMVRWHHQLNGHEFEHTLGNSEGQGSLACYPPWDCKESDMTKQLNKNNNFPQVVTFFLPLGCFWLLFLLPQFLHSPISTSTWRLERYHSSDSKDALEATLFPPRGRQQPWLWLRVFYCTGALSALLSGGSSTVASGVWSSKLSVHTGRACQDTDAWVPPAELFSQGVGGGAREPLFLTSFQIRLMLLVQGQHSEIQHSHQRPWRLRGSSLGTSHPVKEKTSPQEG